MGSQGEVTPAVPVTPQRGQPLFRGLAAGREHPSPADGDPAGTQAPAGGA